MALACLLANTMLSQEELLDQDGAHMESHLMSQLDDLQAQHDVRLNKQFERLLNYGLHHYQPVYLTSVVLISLDILWGYMNICNSLPKNKKSKKTDIFSFIIWTKSMSNIHLYFFYFLKNKKLVFEINFEIKNKLFSKSISNFFFIKNKN